ncbi:MULTISPECIES: CPBP family intramembrane glutamic endopeptidase [Peribacillus]|uniref:CPBP family intramembrane glutamic endopeptidase n=1 Tax=Peribacillus TaxID=2675229 RepID=UPI001F4D8337|nr:MULTISPECIES: type II CAAX endopeptidase family protein [unclassified Peribacillus]MCK1986124.1 CPBP family intramembrane metalloprotease [Peribacillus sp. Aquil_B1]MCK2010746.1 CPBP family intramembrane metalloprotease [Peribacillus sp. Aquil_B8]
MDTDIKQTHRFILYITILIMIIFPFAQLTLQELFLQINKQLFFFISKLVIIYVLFLFLKKKKITLSSIMLKKVHIKYILLGILMGGIAHMLTVFFGRIQHYLLTGEWLTAEKIVSTLMESSKNISFYSIIMIGFSVAISEEILFRGILLKQYQRVNIKSAIIISALIFGMYHMTVGNLFFAFVMGISLALLTIYTGSIVPAIFFHFLVNEIMRIIMHFPDKVTETYFKVMVSPITSISGMILFLSILTFLFMKVRKNSHFQSEKVKFFDRYIILLFLMYVLFLTIK